MVLMVKGKFLNVVSNWANRSGLAVNPSKTEMILFTRRCKIPNVALPSFGGLRLQPVDKLILDRKLT